MSGFNVLILFHWSPSNNMTLFNYFYDQIADTSLASWSSSLPDLIDKRMDRQRWGDLPTWLSVLHDLPSINITDVDYTSSVVRIGQSKDCDDDTRAALEAQLRRYHPWRKGPFELCGMTIDTEWRSDLKWNRLKEHIFPLQGRTVLDIGAANGYHCFRMLGAGAKMAVGIEPTLLYMLQFHAFYHYAQTSGISVLPLGIDDMPSHFNVFDTVFSMGLLYHRRSPFDHLIQCRDLLRDGGELVLETIVIDGGDGDVFSPKGRYAKMPNVWFIPSVLTLEHWLKRMHFKNVRCVDVSVTTAEEQRVTDWMGFESLPDFLDPHDTTKTVEGYPAPKRAVMIAQT